MRYVIGSAVEIISEVDVVVGITMTLDKLIDPNGVSIFDEDTDSNGQSMAFSDASNTLAASVIWQSTIGTHALGRYTYFTKATNSINNNYAEGHFYLKGKT